MPITAALAGLGWVASPVIKKLVNDSISYLGSNIAEGLDDLLATHLPQIQAAIQAAQYSPREDLLAMWLARLKNAYFDAEAILHDLEYERLKHKVKREDNKPLAKFISRVRLSSKPIIKPLAKFTGGVAKKASLLSPQKRALLKRLKKLKKVAEEAITFRDLLKEFKQVAAESKTESIQNAGKNHIVPTSLLSKADKVIGRDGDRDKVINFLLDEGDIYSVVAITGMGGVGKTTLAKYICNNETVQRNFPVRMWLCLSKNLNITELTEQMIECASNKECPKIKNPDLLQKKLIETLPNKVLVILDDVWYEENDRAIGNKIWESLLKPFATRYSQGGTCKIMVISRSTMFPRALQPKEHIELSNLAPNDFKSLIRSCTIDVISDPQLKNDLKESNIVDQIAEKISKLPLAAEVIGNQLCAMPDIASWRATLENVNLRDIMEILLWSFHRFDMQLQQCFLFCSVFPKGTKFNDLVPYWVALDFIRPLDDNRSVEDIGSQYIKIMLANSIFHLVDEKYVMHDLFHDLAEQLSAEDCCRITNAERKVPSTVQHVFLQVNTKNLKNTLSGIRSLKNLRTLILGNSFIDDIGNIISRISTSFRNLRVLEVWSSWGYKKPLPTVVGNFRNLRLLSIGNSSIEKLPNSVLKLYHLQFLLLPGSIAVPKKLSSFIQLQHIKVYNHKNSFYRNREEGYELHQLGLFEIGSSLRISGLCNVKDKDEAAGARLSCKSKLKRLELEFNDCSKVEVIEALRPPANLESLTIDGYGGSTYPTWLQEENIKNVTFYNCHFLTNLPPNFHQFRQCSVLTLHKLYSLTELSNFPENLDKLKISKCERLIIVRKEEPQMNNKNENSFKQFLKFRVSDYHDVLEYESWNMDDMPYAWMHDDCEKAIHRFRNIVRKIVSGSTNADVHTAWWNCHKLRMENIYCYHFRANKLELPSNLRTLELGYCWVSDGALSDCLRGIATLHELYLEGIMTITTLPAKEVFKSLHSLQILGIKHCWYLRSLGGINELPHLKLFRIEDCYCLEMESGHTPLPPKLQFFFIKSCAFPRAILCPLSGGLPRLQSVVINNCLVPRTLSIHQLTKLKSLKLIDCPDLISIEGSKSRPFIDTLHLVMLPNLSVEYVIKSWQGCQEELFISSSGMLNQLLSSQNFVPPQLLGLKYSHEEAITFEKSNHLQSIKRLLFLECKASEWPESLSDFSTLEEIEFTNCPELLRLPELPRSVQHIRMRGCSKLYYRCQPDKEDWHKIQYIQNREIVLYESKQKGILR